MKSMQLISFLMLATLLVSGAAFAEAISGKIMSVDQGTKSIKVSALDAATGAEKEVSIWVQESTSFSGVADLASLKEGAQVTIEATEDAATGDWKAESVTVAEGASETQAA